MTNNLVAELIRNGVAPRNVAKEVARVLKVSERTARNKISGETDFTVPEAVRINETCFGGQKDLEYLFAQTAPQSAGEG